MDSAMPVAPVTLHSRITSWPGAPNGLSDDAMTGQLGFCFTSNVRMRAPDLVVFVAPVGGVLVTVVGAALGAATGGGEGAAPGEPTLPCPLVPFCFAHAATVHAATASATRASATTARR